MPPRRGEIPLVPAEARPFEVRVALMKAHRATLGDLQGLSEIRGGTVEVGTSRSSAPFSAYLARSNASPQAAESRLTSSVREPGPASPSSPDPRSPLKNRPGCSQSKPLRDEE
jgi:hypothetical protein